MRYTQGQIRELLGIPVETYRHWRNVIPALRRLSGRGACFSAGHIVAIAVLRELDDAFGIRIKYVSKGVDRMIELFEIQSWPALEKSTLMLGQFEAVLVQDERQFSMGAQPYIVMPCAPLVSSVRERLLSTGEPEAQASLRFPLMPLSRRQDG